MRIVILIIGIIKLFFSLLILIGCLSAIMESGVIGSKLAFLYKVAVLAIVVGFYLYYAVRTAFWNLFYKSYRGNLPLVVGVVIHLIFMIYSAVDFARFYAMDKVILVMPFILVGFLIGVYDILKLIKSFKFKKKEITTTR